MVKPSEILTGCLSEEQKAEIQANRECLSRQSRNSKLMSVLNGYDQMSATVKNLMSSMTEPALETAAQILFSDIREIQDLNRISHIELEEGSLLTDDGKTIKVSELDGTLNPESVLTWEQLKCAEADQLSGHELYPTCLDLNFTSGDRIPL